MSRLRTVCLRRLIEACDMQQEAFLAQVLLWSLSMSYSKWRKGGREVSACRVVGLAVEKLAKEEATRGMVDG